MVKMKKLNSFDAATEYKKLQQKAWYARLSPPNFEAMELGNKGAAMALWAERVGQKQTVGSQSYDRRTVWRALAETGQG
ncbi:hypothetical protein D3C85_1532890 [compost metagenome]